MSETENKTRKETQNRPQMGSGPTYSDSPSDNVNSSITSSPTDTLRTSKNSAAKITKNLTPVFAKIRKFKNNDYKIDYSIGWNGTLRCVKKILQLDYRGGSYYKDYETPKGVLSLRISGHNANGNNFSPENINISVYVTLFEYEHIRTNVKYTEFRITEDTYNKDPQKVAHEIVDAVERALNGDEFEIDNEIADKTSYEIESEIPKETAPLL